MGVGRGRSAWQLQLHALDKPGEFPGLRLRWQLGIHAQAAALRAHKACCSC